MSQKDTQDLYPPLQFSHTPGGHLVADRTGCLISPSSTEDFHSQHPLDTKDLGPLGVHERSPTEKQEQMRDIFAQLQTGLQAFLQLSMEQMSNRMVPSQAAPSLPASTVTHIVSITLVSALKSST